MAIPSSIHRLRLHSQVARAVVRCVPVLVVDVHAIAFANLASCFHLASCAVALGSAFLLLGLRMELLIFFLVVARH